MLQPRMQGCDGSPNREFIEVSRLVLLRKRYWTETGCGPTHTLQRQDVMAVSLTNFGMEVVTLQGMCGVWRQQSLVSTRGGGKRQTRQHLRRCSRPDCRLLARLRGLNSVSCHESVSDKRARGFDQPELAGTARSHTSRNGSSNERSNKSGPSHALSCHSKLYPPLAGPWNAHTPAAHTNTHSSPSVVVHRNWFQFAHMPHTCNGCHLGLRLQC